MQVNNGAKGPQSRIVRAGMITLSPSLAELCPDAFARAHMDEAVEFLLHCAKTNDLRCSQEARVCCVTDIFAS